MRKISRVEPVLPAMPKRKKVAAYARVSRDTERLAHSLSAQVSYYSTLIQGNPEWEYAGVYADFAVSGTGTGHRDEFLQMVSDCEAGKIDIVLTKSISRFARNTVDLLETVRHLKGLGIEVRFEKEHINSMSGDGELMLSILASFAQEESRSISENSKWGIRKRYQSGEIGAKNKRVFGYSHDGETYVIVPDEAEIVKLIFERFTAGVPLGEIKHELNEMGATSCRGYGFSYGQINYILRNEIYIGDRKYQKCFVEDPIRKNKVPNRGQLPQYYIEGDHAPIISREVFEKAQAEIERRAVTINPTYCFTGRIKCGICGMRYTRRKGTTRGRDYVSWFCRAKKEVGMSCTSENFNEDELERICAETLGMDEFDGEAFTGSVREMTVLANGDIEFQLVGGGTKVWKNLRLSLPRHTPTVTDCFQGKIRCAQCGNTYHRVNGAGRWVYWYCIGKKRKNVDCHNANYPDYHLRQISAYMMGMGEFDETEFEKQIEGITVLEDGSLEYHFREGRTAVWQKA